MSVITAENLTFRYPEARSAGVPFALELASWEVQAGQRIALFGPSGCGKSTLLNLVAGLLVPTSGSLRVLDVDLSRASDAARRAHRIRHIGFIFQDFPLVDYLSASDNVLLPYRINPALTLDSGARTRAQQLLEQLGIGQLAARRPSELSQGERQRVAIARALVTEPALLLADEPTAGLDAARAATFMNLLQTLSGQRGLTVLMVTHDASLLPRFDATLNIGHATAEAAQ